MHTEKAGEPILDVRYFKNVILILLETARGVLNSLICAAYLSNNFNSVFNKKKLEKLVGVLAV